MAAIKDAALYYAEDLGCSVLPLEPNGKRPLGEWKHYQATRASGGEITSDWPAEHNLGLITGAISGIVVIDCESREDAEWFYRHRGRSPVISKTRRGYHLFFHHPRNIAIPNAVRVEGRYDIRADGGYVVAPPSTVAGAKYHFLPGYGLRDPGQLPRFRAEWLPETTGRAGLERPRQTGRIHDVAAYISRIQATSGAGGHNATWRVVQRIKDAGLDQIDALRLLETWNETNASPPWSARELEHKIRQAYRD